MTPIFDLTPQLGMSRGELATKSADEELTPFSLDDFADEPTPANAEPIADLVAQDGKMTGTLSGTSTLGKRATSYLNGLSLSAILQMLHMERKTCVVDVSAQGWLGALTLINGELVDARVDSMNGEEAAYAILSMTDPSVMIAEGVETVQPTVSRPITQIIMDAARRIDETGVLPPGLGTNTLPAQPEHDWQWLTDSLILFGAQNVRILNLAAQDFSATGTLGEPAGDLARAVRTWTTLLGEGASEVVLTRSDRMIILAPINNTHSSFVYAETLNIETTDRIRRSLRSMSLHR
ncbi:MAG TPA: DUF4388 domain-containing protein [Thermomicrobiales bacterium]|nr:DUF4388 domain-containing protein [Thermomicrobiales bacterium]